MIDVKAASRNKFLLYLYLFLTLSWTAGLFMALDIYIFMLSLGDKAAQSVVWWWFFMVALSAISLSLSAYVSYRYFKKLRSGQSGNHPLV